MSLHGNLHELLELQSAGVGTFKALHLRDVEDIRTAAQHLQEGAGSAGALLVSWIVGLQGSLSNFRKALHCSYTIGWHQATDHVRSLFEDCSMTTTTNSGPSSTELVKSFPADAEHASPESLTEVARMLLLARERSQTPSAECQLHAPVCSKHAPSLGSRPEALLRGHICKSHSPEVAELEQAGNLCPNLPRKPHESCVARAGSSYRQPRGLDHPRLLLLRFRLWSRSLTSLQGVDC
mmetsp:Transcript_83058/g.144213  ORF Transcript_83058/g.144213 Transcript_83058/m.144213 type:complete len:237 (-) Transcript_83058:296-1006(-)